MTPGTARFARKYMLDALAGTEGIAQCDTDRMREVIVRVAQAAGPGLDVDLAGAFDLVILQQRAAGAAAQVLAMNDVQELPDETLRVVHDHDLPTPRRS